MMAALLIITTAAAPALSPNTARATRAQFPRTVTTTLPAVPAYSASLQPSETEPLELRSTFTPNGPLGMGAPLASIVVTAPPDAPPAEVRLSVAPGKVSFLNYTAATER